METECNRRLYGILETVSLLQRGGKTRKKHTSVKVRYGDWVEEKMAERPKNSYCNFSSKHKAAKDEITDTEIPGHKKEDCINPPLSLCPVGLDL